MDDFLPGAGFAPSSGIEDFNLAFDEGGGNPPSVPGHGECKGQQDGPGCDDPEGEGNGQFPQGGTPNDIGEQGGNGPPSGFLTLFDNPPGTGNPPFVPQLLLLNDTTRVTSTDEGRVPLPGTLALFAAGLLSLFGRCLRR